MTVSEFQGIRAAHQVRQKVKAEKAIRKAAKAAADLSQDAAEVMQRAAQDAADAEVRRLARSPRSLIASLSSLSRTSLFESLARSGPPSFESFVQGIGDDPESRLAMQTLLDRGWRPPSVGSGNPGFEELVSQRDPEEGLFPLSEEGWILKAIRPPLRVLYLVRTRKPL